ncbi:MAG: hypothetical protein AUJ74_00650 [Candidatus Omnitrophica bacterium CG1_02_44_16]|nr:MAG: hypothetical protein AUJ74_00650 [Candidatus Omnitrophica bacterium CG1_02_44_16]
MKEIRKKKYFFTGLLIVLPILITVYLFISLFAFFDNILGRYISRLTLALFGYKIPGLGLLVFAAIIFFTGFFATNFIGRKFLRYMESFWFKFPIVKKVYPAAKQITHFLFGEKLQGRFQKVALAHFPNKDCYSICFITNETTESIKAKTGKDLMNCLIPAVPNPITGYLLFIPREDLIFLDMSVEEAVKIIVSGGVLNPEDILKQANSVED